MKRYCKIILMCLQATVLFGAQLEAPTKQGRRRSPVRPPEKTQTTSDRSVPIKLTQSSEIAISLTKSGEMRLQSQAKSPSQAITPGDYFFWASDQGCSPSFRD